MLTASIRSFTAFLPTRRPRTGRLQNIEAVERYARGFLRDYLDAHRSEIDVVDLDLAAFILVTTVEALTHSAVLRRPDVLADEKAGEFVDEVTRLVLRYLRTPSRLRRGMRASPQENRGLVVRPSIR